MNNNYSNLKYGYSSTISGNSYIAYGTNNPIAIGKLAGLASTGVNSIAIGVSASYIVGGTNNTFIGGGYYNSFTSTGITTDKKIVSVFCDGKAAKKDGSTSYIIEGNDTFDYVKKPLFNGVCSYPWKDTPPGHFLNGKLVTKEKYKNALIGKRFSQNETNI
jgi:hypothetical protein